MIDQKIREISEVLARAVDRRTFMKRAGGILVAGVSAIVLKPALANAGAAGSAASGKSIASMPDISCSPPGPYCNIGGGDLSGCRGGHCFAHGTVANVCKVYYTYYATGCWTAAGGGGGYWTCCDCQCTNGNTCGCAQYNPGGDPRSH